MIFTNETIAATGGLTDAELRATPVPVATDGLTDAELRATPVDVLGPLTDAELRATPVPVSTGGLTDAELRASAVEVEVTNFPGAAAGTATVSRVATSGTVATLLAANPDRKKVIVVTELGTTFIKLGTGASSTDYSFYAPARSTIEFDSYLGEVTVIRSSGTGDVQVTEIE